MKRSFAFFAEARFPEGGVRLGGWGIFNHNVNLSVVRWQDADERPEKPLKITCAPGEA